MRSGLTGEVKTQLINSNEIRVKVESTSKPFNINEIKLSRRFISNAGNLVEKVRQSLLAHAARESCPRESV